MASAVANDEAAIRASDSSYFLIRYRRPGCALAVDDVHNVRTRAAKDESYGGSWPTRTAKIHHLAAANSRVAKYESYAGSWPARSATVCRLTSSLSVLVTIRASASSYVVLTASLDTH